MLTTLQHIDNSILELTGWICECGEIILKLSASHSSIEASCYLGRRDEALMARKRLQAIRDTLLAEHPEPKAVAKVEQFS